MKRHSREEIIAYETAKLNDGDVHAAGKFKSKAIDIQHKAYDKDFANEKFEIACEILTSVGHCSQSECESCPLSIAHNTALTEIEAGTRNRIEKDKPYKRNIKTPGYWVSIYVDKHGKVTTVMRPFVKKDKVDIQESDRYLC